MGFSNLISLLGGAALFLFGMTLMGDGLKKAAGNKLELVLYRLSGTPLKALLLGTGVTAVIQSSSATSVMVVGFVNSGMMKLTQAANVILGALIGTSITGWVISLSSVSGSGVASVFSTATLSAVIAIIGIIFRMFIKKHSYHHIGDIMLGFAVLMFGMQSMSAAVSPLKDSPEFISLLTAFSHPFLGIIIGIVFTSILQSASAAVGILQALSMTGAINFSAAYPILLGISIGAAVPVLLSALGAKADGKRAAFSYLVLSAVGVVVCAILYYVGDAIFSFSIGDITMNTVSIALVNTLFRAVGVLATVPFTGIIMRLISKAIRPSKLEMQSAGELDRLDERFLATPALAVEQSRLVMCAMAKTAQENLLRSMKLIFNYSDEEFRTVEAVEELIDTYEDKMGTYLVKLNTHELNKTQNDNVSKFLHTLTDFERIGDHAINLAEAAGEIHEKKISFSAGAIKELEVLFAATREILQLAVDSFLDNDVEKAYRVEPLEEHIDNICEQMKRRHVERVQNGECTLSQGFVFHDILGNIERVADHSSNLAVAEIELEADAFDTHSYINEVKELKTHNFSELYDEYSKRYEI